MIEFKRVLDSEGQSMDLRHLELLADFMFNKGQPNSITYRGIMRQRDSILSMMTLEQALPTLVKAAATGRNDPLLSTSATILLGQRSLIGTGYIGVLQDEKAFKEHEEAVQKALEQNQKVSNADLEEALDSLDNDAYGIQSTSFGDANVNDDELESQIIGKRKSKEKGKAKAVINTRPEQVIQSKISTKAARDEYLPKPVPLVSSTLSDIAQGYVVEPLREDRQLVIISEEKVPKKKKRVSFKDVDENDELKQITEYDNQEEIIVTGKRASKVRATDIVTDTFDGDADETEPVKRKSKIKSKEKEVVYDMPEPEISKGRRTSSNKKAIAAPIVEEVVQKEEEVPKKKTSRKKVVVEESEIVTPPATGIATAVPKRKKKALVDLGVLEAEQKVKKPSLKEFVTKFK
jgi:hypothetical protein